MRLRVKETITGICGDCLEWTSIVEPCCNAKVWFEGGWLDPDDFREDEEDGSHERI